MFGLSLNPYMMYIKIAAVVAILAFTFWGGHHVAFLSCEAGKTKAVLQAQALLEKSIKQYQKRLETLEGINSATVTENQAVKAKMKTDRSKFEKDLQNATSKTGDVKLSVGYWRLWNGSNLRTNGSVPTGTPDTASTVEENNTITDRGLSDTLRNHDEVTQLCGEWKADLDSIFNWDVKTYPAH